jgi:hypothetical protein
MKAENSYQLSLLTPTASATDGANRRASCVHILR